MKYKIVITDNIMGQINSFSKMKLFVGILFNQIKFFDEVKPLLINNFGQIDFESDQFEFFHSNYYQEEMGDRLYKKFISVQNLVEPDDIYKIKYLTNDIEEKFSYNKKRNINLDPGLITAHNVMLLTTKNFAHRIPLQKGIYAELTLIWQKKGYIDLPWTYPDFQTSEYKETLGIIRDKYLKELVNMKGN